MWFSGINEHLDNILLLFKSYSLLAYAFFSSHFEKSVPATYLIFTVVTNKGIVLQRHLYNSSWKSNSLLGVEEEREATYHILLQLHAFLF